MDDPTLVAALRLMRMALPLLDRCGRDIAAVRLLHAIDEAERSGRVDGSDPVSR